MNPIILSTLAIFSLLCLFAVTIGKRKSLSDIALGLSALCLAAIEAAEQYGGEGAYSEYKALGVVLAALLPACLLWYGFTFARSEPVAFFSRRGVVLLSAAVLLPTAAIVFPLTDLFNHRGAGIALFPGEAGSLYYLAALVSFIIALMNIEATFVSTATADRGKIKYEVIGAGSILTVLIFTFSQAMLYPTTIAELQSVRAGLFIIASCLILYSKLVCVNGVNVTVSRYMMYRSLTLLSVGIYFVALGTIGEGIRYFDVPFGRYLTIFLSFGGGIALLIAIFSETLRRSLMVFLSKHFFEHKHDYRHTWLDLSSRLASCMTVTDMERAIPAAYREIFGLRSAYLYLFNRTSGRYLPAGQHQVAGPDIGFIPSEALQSYFCDRNRVWNPFDGEYEPDDEEISFISTSRARLVVPLVCNRKTEGVVVFGEPIGEEPFTYEDYDLMKIVARQAALLLNNLRLSEELIETRELAATARLSSFVVHDLKNLAYTLALLTHNAEEHMGNMQFQRDMITAIRNALENVKQLTEKLKVVGQGGASRMERHDLRDLSTEVVEEMRKTRPDADIVCRGDSAHAVIDTDELKKVIINLVQNGLEAGGERAQVTIKTGWQNGSVCLTITDSGSGMTRAFMQHQLFRPFHTTKKTGLGIGLYQCKKIIESLGGTIEVTSESGKGSSFTVRLPAADRALSFAR